MADRFTVANRRARVLQLRSMGLSTSAIAEAEARESGNPRRTTSAILSDLKYALAAAKDAPLLRNPCESARLATVPYRISSTTLTPCAAARRPRYLFCPD